MITSVAFLPHPPLLLPGMTGRPVAEVEGLRAACLAAIGQVLDSAPDEIVVLGSMRSDEVGEPLSIKVGRSLLEEAHVRLPAETVALPVDATLAALREAGSDLAARPGSIGLLVMGDGSARRTLKAPGYLDERAEPYDQQVEWALTSAEPLRLIELDRALAETLMVAGWAAWQAAGWALRDSGPWDGELLHASDPFGVYYAVTVWRPAAA